MKINVTQENIDAGQKFSQHSCPIARAVKDKYLIKPDVRVSKEDITITRFFGLIKKEYDLPKEARDFVYNFDRWNSVAPFEFEVK